MADLPAPTAVITRIVSRLRFPKLAMLLGILFVADLLMPDFVPFIDEIFLALMTALFANWKTRKVVPETEP